MLCREGYQLRLEWQGVVSEFMGLLDREKN